MRATNGGRPPFEAWLTVVDEVTGEEARVDLALVRGLDHVGGPQEWSAMPPPDLADSVLLGHVTCDTAGDLPPHARIAWPISRCKDGHTHVARAVPLAHSLS